MNTEFQINYLTSLDLLNSKEEAKLIAETLVQDKDFNAEQFITLNETLHEFDLVNRSVITELALYPELDTFQLD